MDDKKNHSPAPPNLPGHIVYNVRADPPPRPPTWPFLVKLVLTFVIGALIINIDGQLNYGGYSISDDNPIILAWMGYICFLGFVYWFWSYR